MKDQKSKKLGVPAIAAIVVILSILAIAAMGIFAPLMPDVPWGPLASGIQFIGGIAGWVLVISGVIWLIKFFSKKTR